VALLGVLGVPAAICASMLMAMAGASETAAFLGAMAVVGLGLLLSILALVLIRSGRPRYTGTGLAVTGIVLPCVVGILIVPMLMIAPGEALEQDSIGQSEQVRQDVGTDEAEIALRDLITRLEHLVAAEATPADFLELVDPRMRSALERDATYLWNNDAGGLATVNIESLTAPLSQHRVAKVITVGDEATMTLVHGIRALSFPLIKVDGQWYFGVGKVVRSAWTE
jgi:hypothetical protein